MMKRILAGVLCAVLLTVCAAMPFVSRAFAADTLPGDVNKDTKINATDLTVLARYLMDKNSVSIRKANAVLTEAGDTPKVGDLQRLARYLSGIDEEPLVSRYALPPVVVG